MAKTAGLTGHKGTGTTTSMTTRAGASHDQSAKMPMADEARAWLHDKGALANTKDLIDIGALKATLMLLIGRKETPVEVKEGLKVVAMGLEEVKAAEMGKLMLDTVGKAMGECREVLENMAEAVKMVRKMVEQAKKATGGWEEGQIEESRAERNEREEERGEERRTQLLTMGMNYAQAAQRAKHEEVLQRVKNRSKQMIVDNIDSKDSWNALTERELVEKTKIAKDLMGIQGLDGPKVEFVLARKLKNGGILYELNTVEAVEWLAKPDVRAAFLDKFGTGAMVKDRAYNVFVEFVPIGLGNTLADQLEALEDSNDLHPGELVAARWARAPKSRNEHQKVAHLILSCASCEGTNRIIKGSLIVEGKRVSARKLNLEFRRCLKCQRYGKGHLANECKQVTDTCGLCAKEHKTRECKETDPEKYTCINCKVRGAQHNHPLSSRLCLVFVEAKSRLIDRSPELKYKYYLTNQQWTWLRTDDVREAILDHQGPWD